MLLLVVIALAAVAFAVAWWQGWLPATWRSSVKKEAAKGLETAAGGLEKARDHLKEGEPAEGAEAAEQAGPSED